MEPRRCVYLTVSTYTPRSWKVIPEPTTRSLIVREARTSPVPASAAMRAPMWMATPSTSSPASSTSPIETPSEALAYRVFGMTPGV